MLLRQQVMAILREVFERHGYEPLDTPALEYAATLTGKYGEDEKLLYRFTDHGGREVGLRYDLTVPLARVAALHANELVLPFKRYHIARSGAAIGRSAGASASSTSATWTPSAAPRCSPTPRRSPRGRRPHGARLPRVHDPDQRPSDHHRAGEAGRGRG
jgi:hypothetical protein